MELAPEARPTMKSYRLESLDDAILRRELHRLHQEERPHTADVIAHIAEFDGRRLYLAEAFPSMFAYCVGELRLSEDAAYKRIQAARTARRFPQLFEDVADGRLHLAAVCMLAPHLTAENVGELVSAATHRSKAQIETWLASRFAPASAGPAPRARVTRIAPVPATTAMAPGDVCNELAPGQVDLPVSAKDHVEIAEAQRPMPTPAAATPAKVCNRLAPGQVDLPLVPQGAAPPSMPLRDLDAIQFVVRIPIGEKTHAKLRRVQELLGRAVPSGDLAQ